MRYTPALAGDRVAVFGDVHGRADLLAKAHQAIDRLIAETGSRPPIEIYLGDYIDRGPTSSGVIAMLLLRRRTRRLICLRGNHEAMLLDALDDPAALPRWLAAGGDRTLGSYGLSPSVWRAGSRCSVELKTTLPPEHLAFFASLPVGFRLGSMFFVHAGVRPGTLLEQQRDADLLWIREPFLSSQANHGALIVHGHTPTRAIEFRHNRINLDTGAVFTGKLTCLLIGDDGMRLIAA